MQQEISDALAMYRQTRNALESYDSRAASIQRANFDALAGLVARIDDDARAVGGPRLGAYATDAANTGTVYFDAYPYPREQRTTRIRVVASKFSEGCYTLWDTNADDAERGLSLRVVAERLAGYAHRLNNSPRRNPVRGSAPCFMYQSTKDSYEKITACDSDVRYRRFLLGFTAGRVYRVPGFYVRSTPR